MQEGMKRTKNPKPNKKHVPAPPAHTAGPKHWSLPYTTGFPLQSDTDSPGRGDDMTEGLSPTPLLLPRQHPPGPRSYSLAQGTSTLAKHRCRASYM